MSAHFPDVETIRSALMLAVRAPSVHNSQPWLWRVGEHTLHLYANRDLHLSQTDPDARDLMLSCGATLHHCQVAFAALGWQSKVRRFPNPADPNHLAVIELHRSPASEVDIALAAAIPRRRTDRRHYTSWTVPQGDISMMGARAARAGTMLRRVDALTSLRRLIVEAARRHNTDHEYLTELSTWSGRYASIAGVPARSTPEPDTNAALPARSFAGPGLAQTPDGAAADDNAVVVALGTVDDDELSWLRAGEATSMVLLTATAIGTGQLSDHRAAGDCRNPDPDCGGRVRRRWISTDAIAYRLGAGQCRPVARHAAPVAERHRDLAGRLEVPLGPIDCIDVNFDAEHRPIAVLGDGPAGIVKYSSHGIVLEEDIGDKAMLAGIFCDVAECLQQCGANSPLVLFVCDNDRDLAFTRSGQLGIVGNADQLS